VIIAVPSRCHALEAADVDVQHGHNVGGLVCLVWGACLFGLMVLVCLVLQNVWSRGLVCLVSGSRLFGLGGSFVWSHCACLFGLGGACLFGLGGARLFGLMVLVCLVSWCSFVWSHGARLFCLWGYIHIHIHIAIWAQVSACRVLCCSIRSVNVAG
jgi:hypothetical protein